jgi:hypothetical protein
MFTMRGQGTLEPRRGDKLEDTWATTLRKLEICKLSKCWAFILLISGKKNKYFQSKFQQQTLLLHTHFALSYNAI